MKDSWDIYQLKKWENDAPIALLIIWGITLLFLLIALFN